MTGRAGSATGSGVTTWAGSLVSPAAIPLGDGKVTTTSARVGYVYSCASQFRGGGARHSGSWINTAAGTWNAKAQAPCGGGEFAARRVTLLHRARSEPDPEDQRPTGRSHDRQLPDLAERPRLPVRHQPQPRRCPVFRLEGTGRPRQGQFSGLPRPGPDRVSTDAVVFFDALDASGRDAGAHETQDACDGHPQGQGIYHYHTYSPCLSTKASQRPGSSTLVGYALDGYGIYLERDDHGNLPADVGLDACHGRTSAITWDGKRVVMYHYDVTLEYPYTVGCYHGTRSARTRHQGGQMLGQRPSRCPAFRYLGPGGWSRTWVMSVCRARRSARGSRTGGPRIAAARAADRLTRACPSPGTHRPGAAIFPACRFASRRVSAAGSIW